MGVHKETFEVCNVSHNEIFISATLIQKHSGIGWGLIIVYGPTNHDRLRAFLQEMNPNYRVCTWHSDYGRVHMWYRQGATCHSRPLLLMMKLLDFSEEEV